MKKVLIIGKTWLESKSTGAGVRLKNLILEFTKRHYNVTFCSASNKSEYSDDLSIYDVDSKKIELNSSSFNTYIQQLNPDLVIFDRFTTEEQFGWRVRDATPYALTILDTEDLHFLRDARKQLIQKGKYPYSQSDEIMTIRKNEVTFREIAAIYRCDLSLVISQYEFELLQKIDVPEKLLFYLPMSVNSISQSILPLPFEQRKNFIFFGNFNHAPNLDALQFIYSIFPELKRLDPSIEIHIYGAYLKNHQLTKNKNGIYFHGWTEDLHKKIAQARVLFAPLRFGAGLKSKILESMYLGTPIVSTPIGFEGIIKNGDYPGYCSNIDEIWIDKALHLHNDKNEWTKSSKTALSLFDSLCSDYKALNDQFFIRLNDLEKNIETHRASNIIGNILSLEMNKSYKFLSRYIEEKNKRRPNS
jgi:glycosyltransferase involved in cell wall biosynthesis